MKNTFTLLTLKKWNRHLVRTTVIAVSLILICMSGFTQISAPNVSRCGEGVVTLNATTSLTGGTLTWYDVPFYGAPIATGVSFTTPVLQESTTFYVDYVVDGVGVCDRKPVNATISTSSVTPSIFYASLTYCSSLDEFQEVTNTGSALGQYTSSPALTSANLNPTSGAFNPYGLSPGQYTITYTIAPANQPVGCNESPSTVVLNVGVAPVQAVIYYGSTAPSGETPAPAVSYCTNAGTITVHRNNESPSTGTYSATPSGLSLNSTTGAINTANSLSGTYTITYFVPGVGGCSFVRATANTVTILQLPTATISYATLFCKSSTSVPVTLTGTGVFSGGSYTQTAGSGTLSLNSSTGEINPSASNAGTYTVSYTLAAVSPCAQVVAQTTFVVLPATTAAISGTSAICSGGNTDLSIALTGTSPWSFTYTDGATPIMITGQITNSATIAVSPFSTKTYTLTSVNDAHCAGTTSGSATVTVNAAPLATFEYSGSPFCSNGTNPTPNMLGVGTKGVFTSTNGLVFVNASTGEIDLLASTAGTYTVTNKIAASGGCSEVTATSDVTITKLPIAGFTYASEAYCTNGTNPSPVMGEGAVKGLFSSTAGLEFVSLTTGEINLTASSPGTYTITNTIAAATGCGVVTSTTTVEIKAIPAVVAGYSRGICIGNSTILGATAVSGNTYLWSASPTDASLTETTSAQPTVSPTVTTTYTLVESNGSCTNTRTVKVEVLSLPAANAISGTNLLCAGGSVSYSVTDHSSDGGLYEWQYTGTGATINAITSPTTTISFANATSGTLKLTENIGGCSYVNTYEITVNADPAWNITAPAASINYGSTVTFSETVENGLGGTVTWIRSTTSGGTGTTVTSPDTPPAVGTYYYRPHFEPTGIGCNLSDGTETTVVVGQATLTVTGLTGVNKTYNGNTNATATGTAALSGIENSDDVTLEGTPVYTFASKDVAPGVSISTTGYTLGGTKAGNYTLTQPTLSANITKATLTATAADKTKVYGATNPELTFAYTDWVNGVETIDTPPTISTTVTTATAVGANTGSITLSGGSDNNYTFNLVTGSLAVTKAELTVTATDKAKVYGATIPELTFTYSGWQNDNDATDLTTEPTASTTVTAFSNVYVYTNGITLAGGVDENYSFTYVPADLTVTKAVLTVTAHNKSKTVDGSAFSPFTSTIEGFITGDDIGYVNGLPVTYTGDATTTTTAGVYNTITPVVSGLSATNYSFTPVNGTLTIKPVAPIGAYGGATCEGYPLSLTASTVTGATGYSWTGPNNFASTEQNPTVSASATTAMAGVYLVTVTVNGATSDASTVVVVVKANTAKPVITTITAGANTTVTGTSEPGAEIVIYKNGGLPPIGSATANGSGNWTSTITGWTIAADDVITAKASATGKCQSSASDGKTIPAAPTGAATQIFCNP